MPDAHRSSLLSFLATLALCPFLVAAAPGAATALSPAAEFTLLDGAPPDGTADDLFEPPDPNYGQVFQSVVLDSEHYVEFPLAGAEAAADVNLSLGIVASNIDLIRGEAKTFKVSTYDAPGAPLLETFGSGTFLQSISLPTNGVFDLDIDLTDVWNDAVASGDDFLGVRIHDPVWTGTLDGAGRITVTTATLEGVPEPAGTAATLSTLLALRALACRSGRDRR